MDQPKGVSGGVGRLGLELFQGILARFWIASGRFAWSSYVVFLKDIYDCWNIFLIFFRGLKQMEARESEVSADADGRGEDHGDCSTAGPTLGGWPQAARGKTC